MTVWLVVWYDDKSIGEILLKNNLAYRYSGGRKPASVDWCRKSNSSLAP